MPQISQALKTAMEQAKTDMAEKLQRGIPVVNREDAEQYFPDIAPEIALHISDLELESRCRNIYIAASFKGPKALAEVNRVLTQNELNNGPQKKNRSGQLAILQAVMRNKSLPTDVRVEADKLYQDRIVGKGVQQQWYERTIQALEDMYGLPSASVNAEDKKASFMVLNRFYGATQESLDAVYQLQPGASLPLDLSRLIDSAALVEEYSQEVRSEDFRDIIQSSSAYFDRVHKVLFGKAEQDYPDFDWTEAVFIDGVSLKEETQNMLLKRNLVPNAHNLKEVQNGLLTHALATDSKVDCLAYNPEEKRFESKSFKLINESNFQLVEGIKDPKMNRWERFWSKWGFFKEKLALQQQYDHQMEIAKAAGKMNNEVFPNCIKRIMQDTEVRSDLLASAAYPPDGKKKDAMKNYFNGSRSWRMQLIAHLMTNHDMTFEEAMNPAHGREIKQQAGQELSAKAARYNSDMQAAIAIAPSGEKDPEKIAQKEKAMAQVAATHSAEYINLVMPWAMRMFNEKIPGDYRDIKTLDANYEKAQVLGHAMFDLFQDASKGAPLAAMSNWIKQNAEACGYNPQQNTPEEYAQVLIGRFSTVGMIYMGCANSAKLRNDAEFLEQHKEPSQMGEILETIDAAFSAKQMFLEKGDKLNAMRSWHELPDEMSQEMFGYKTAFSAWAMNNTTSPQGVNEIINASKNMGNTGAQFDFEVSEELGNMTVAKMKQKSAPSRSKGR